MHGPVNLRSCSVFDTDAQTFMMWLWRDRPTWRHNDFQHSGYNLSAAHGSFWRVIWFLSFISPLFVNSEHLQGLSHCCIIPFHQYGQGLNHLPVSFISSHTRYWWKWKWVYLTTELPDVLSYGHTVGHRRCVFINYIWLNQLSNTTIWWLDICLLPRYQLHVSALMAIFRLMDWQKLNKQLHLACVCYTVEGRGLLDGGTRSRVYWVGRGVYMGLYCAKLI